MPGWAWAVMACMGSALIAAGAVWIWFSRHVAAAAVKAEAAEVKAKAAADEAKSERKLRAAVQREHENLAATLKHVNSLFIRRKADLAKETDRAYRQYVGDPSALDARLAAILTDADRRRRERTAAALHSEATNPGYGQAKLHPDGEPEDCAQPISLASGRAEPSWPVRIDTDSLKPPPEER